MLAEAWEWARDMAWVALLAVCGVLALLLVGPFLLGLGYLTRSERLQDVGFMLIAMPLIAWMITRH